MHGVYGIDYFITTQGAEKVCNSWVSFQVIDTARRQNGYEADELSSYFKSMYLSRFLVIWQKFNYLKSVIDHKHDVASLCRWSKLKTNYDQLTKK